MLHRWEDVLSGLEEDRATVADIVDWVAKERLFEAYRERHGLEWGDARLRAMDIQYHDLRDDRSLFDRLGLETLCTATRSNGP